MNVAPEQSTPATLGGSVGYTPAIRYALLAEEYCRLEAGGDPTDDNELDPREAELLVRQVADQLNAQRATANADKRRGAFFEQLKLDKEGYFEDLKAYYEHGGTSEPFIVAFPSTPVRLDTAREQYYLNLPAQFANLARYKNLPREEFAQVEPMAYAQRVLRSYIPMPGHLSQQVIGLYTSGLQGNVGFQREGAILWFYPVPGQKVPDATVLLKVVIRQRGETLLPEVGLLAAASDIEILSAVWALRKGRGKQDKHNDANPQIG